MGITFLVDKDEQEIEPAGRLAIRILEDSL